MTTIYDLPKPTNAALERSKALTTYLIHQINQEGMISFSAFMENALYHPAYGYYNASTFTLGKKGDFTTAPIISPLFAQCFAEQCRQFFLFAGTHDILEIGAGTGQFAKSLLDALEKSNSLPSHYYIYEISPHLKKVQQAYLRSNCPASASRVIWLDQLPVDFKGIVFANEVLDALPFDCFSIHQDKMMERCVTWEKNQFSWHLTEPRTPGLAQLANKIQAQYHLDEGYESEINLTLPNFLTAITNALKEGIILFADYGYGQREYYHPERRLGTLTCFYQHHHHHNPLILPGLQDITAHVDFTQVAEYGAGNGCTLMGYTTQAAFLLSLGLIEMAAEKKTQILSAADEFELHQAIKVLTFPTEMGDRVKLIAFSKGISEDMPPLVGFKQQDRRRDL